MFGLVLDASLRVIVAAAAVGLVLVVLRVRSGTARHAAWSAVLLAMLGMPLLVAMVPRVEVPVPDALLIDAPRFALDESENPVDAAPRLNIPPAPSPAPMAAAAQPFTWQRVVAAVYVSGVLFFLLRLGAGWIAARRMVRSATRAGLASRVPVLVSPAVATPLTVGVIRPAIVLPREWTEWSAAKLAAVLAHENAHIARRDSLISLLALANRAVFWFHPVAWWLERTIAVAAEHACDEVAAREVGDAREYAQVLVDMADAVRLRGQRVAWQALGVDGAGHLGARIDRLLRGDAFARMSTPRQVTAAVACVSVLALAIACRKQIAPLREDPALATQLAKQDEEVKKFEAARDMTQAEADALEQKIAANPEDFDTRRQLVTYYQASSTVAWNKKVPGLRRHALWLIEHHPEHDVRPPSLSPQYDPEGFASATKLWSAHVSKPGASPFLIYRAASFFAPHDKARAEELMLRGLAMDPESAALKARMPANVALYEWPSQLASLYASAVAGSESVWGTINDLRTHLDRLQTPFAMKVRQQLDASTDARLLATVGSRLTQRRGYSKDPAIKAAEDQTRALGVRYLERALQLDPTLETAKISLYMATARETLNDADRMVNRAHERYMISEDITEYAKKDPGKAKAEREQAIGDARKVLDMAKAHAGDPAYSAAVMTAHHLLAVDALRNEDRDQAVLHLRESLKVPASDQIKYAPPYSWMRPVNRLLKEGEREGVVEFLEGYAQLTVRERQRLLDDAKAIREGRMPLAYQHMVYRETAPSPFKPR